MLTTIEKIVNLSQKRIKHLHNTDSEGFYKGYNTYIKYIEGELEEVKEEIKKNNSVFLEDELGDVFWCYMGLVHSLEEEGMIDKEKVFKRCFNKFSERLADFSNSGEDNWQKVKAIQKEERLKEHNNLYNN